MKQRSHLSHLAQLPFPSTVLVWCVGIFLTFSISLTLFFTARRTVERDASMRFESVAITTKHGISTRVKSFNDLVRSVVALFQASDNLSRAQFHQFVMGLELPRNFPAIESLNFAQYVADSDKSAFEAKVRQDRSMRSQGYPQFSVKSEGRHAHYFVLNYMEPQDYDNPKFGLDIGSRPQMAQSLEFTRDSGALIASGQPALVDGPNPYKGLSLRLAVYRNGMPLTTVAERQAAYLGSVCTGFQVPKLIQSALDEMPVRDIHVMLFDGGKYTGDGPAVITEHDTLLFDSAGATAKTTALIRHAQGSDSNSFNTTLPIDFNGRLWKAHFSIPKEALYTPFDFYLPWIVFAASMIGTLLIYSLFFTLSSSRRRAVTLARTMTAELRASQVQLQESHHKLRQLAAHTDQIREDERKRIAREIHDDLGQNLLVLRIDVVMLATRTQHNHPKLHLKVSDTLRQIDNTIRSVRQIINDLRPNVLDLGLNAAVEWQIAQFEQRTGIKCTLIENQSDIVLDDKSATAFFRILQESLSNISRHANASQVRVVLHRANDSLSMTVADNGMGMQSYSRYKTGSFGLIGIEERISLLGGTVHIESSPGAGVTVSVTVPLPARRA